MTLFYENSIFIRLKTKTMKKLPILFLLICFINNISAQKENDYERAEDAFLLFRYEEAKTLYTSLLVDNDDEWNYFIYYRRAHCYYGLKQFDEAIVDAKKALRINSKNENYKRIKGESFWLMASIYSEKGNYEKSVEYLKYTAKISNDSYIWNNIGYSQLKSKQYAAALESFNEALKLNIENPYVFSNRSFVYLKLGQLDEAQADIKTALEFDPYNPYAYKYQAMIYLELKDVDNACEALAKSKELGYESFGRLRDTKEVDDLIEKHCNISKE
jgi:tetratricopeptide (TPR) repeat protein